MFNSDTLFIEKWLAQFDIQISLSLPSLPRHLVNDSRALEQGDIFCAVNGTNAQGADYVGDALAKNCHLILVECQQQARHGAISAKNSANGDLVNVIEFYQLGEQLFALAKAFYQAPQQQLHMIGVTGTNGKTSTSQMIAKLLAASGKQCSVIGTNGAGKVEQLTPITNTTPGATELHQWLQEFVEQQQEAVAMEVSSHALEQGRVTAELFDVAVFTNLTRDHLDYHQTMANYRDAKYQIFTQKSGQTAILNASDETAQLWLSTWPAEQKLIVYGRSLSLSSYQQYVIASEIKHQHDGLSFTLITHLGSTQVSSHLIGDFNVDNLLAAIAVLIDANVSLADIASAVKKLTPVIGRMEAFAADDLPLAVVDYAHTPDALSNALQACRQHCQGALWVVFGCGGDRDSGKRSLMGAIAERDSDHVIVTNDNPRNEQPETIANDILSGCKQPEKITVMLERQQAVLSALKQAKNNDVVLLAGKGHEDYIIIGDQKISYNERELIRATYAHGALS